MFNRYFSKILKKCLKVIGFSSEGKCANVTDNNLVAEGIGRCARRSRVQLAVQLPKASVPGCATRAQVKRLLRDMRNCWGNCWGVAPRHDLIVRGHCQ